MMKESCPRPRDIKNMEDMDKFDFMKIDQLPEHEQSMIDKINSIFTLISVITEDTGFKDTPEGRTYYTFTFKNVVCKKREEGDEDMTTVFIDNQVVGQSYSIYGAGYVTYNSEDDLEEIIEILSSKD